MTEIFDLIIIGAGPAGVSAGIYAVRKGLNILLLTKDFENQLFRSSKIENYPGFLSVSGQELTQKLRGHLEKFEIEIKEGETVDQLTISSVGQFKVICESKNEYHTRALIIATGARPRTLEVPGFDKFFGKGISSCETCDGPLFKNKEVVVIGGGNAGLEAAEELTQYTKKVYVLEVKDEITGDELLLGNLKKKVNVVIITSVEIKEFRGKEFLEEILYFDKKENKEKSIKTEGVFVKIGCLPNSESLRGFLNLNEKGEIIIDPLTYETSQKGIFAAGDVTNIPYKQFVIAAGEGAKAALSAYRYLQGRLKN